MTAPLTIITNADPTRYPCIRWECDETPTVVYQRKHAGIYAACDDHRPDALTNYPDRPATHDAMPGDVLARRSINVKPS